jgi:hypothetical protein
VVQVENDSTTEEGAARLLGALRDGLGAFFSRPAAASRR